MKSAEWLLFQQLFRSQVEAVFRYQLIFNDDWQAAEACTAEIFHTALAWFKPQFGQDEAFIPWLWRIARDGRSRRSIPFTETERFRGGEVPQSQLRSFACAAQVSSAWESQSRRVSEALGLFYFGRLEIHEVAALTHMSSDEVRRVILRRGSEILGDLSSELRPVGNFSEVLEQELEEQSSGKNLYRVPLQRWYSRQAGRFPIPFLERAPRMVILAIIIGLSMAAWHSFSLTNPFFEEGAAPLAAIAEQPPAFSFSPILDDLIVVDEFGQTGLLQLDTGALIHPISGFRYFPCAHPTHKAVIPPNDLPGSPARCNLNAVPKPRYPAQVSPDGRWLSITRPIEKDTWILPLDGSGSAQKISNFEARMHWAPDGHAVAFVDARDPAKLAVYDVVHMTAVAIPRLENGHWLSLAWSPDAKWLVGLYLRGGEDAKSAQRIYFVRIEPQVAKWETLAAGALLPEDLRGDLELTFRSDGKEIWMPTAGLNPDRGKLAHLVRDPALTPGSGSDPVDDIRRWYFSWDGNKVAVVETRIITSTSCHCLLDRNQADPGHPKLTYTGWVDDPAWTLDSTSLIVQEPSAAGPTLMRIDPITGRRQTVAANMLLVGVRKTGGGGLTVDSELIVRRGPRRVRVLSGS